MWRESVSPFVIFVWLLCTITNETSLTYPLHSPIHPLLSLSLPFWSNLPLSPCHPHAFLFSFPCSSLPFIFFISFSYYSSLHQSGVMTTIITTALARSGIARLRMVTWWAALAWAMARENSNVNPVSTDTQTQPGLYTWRYQACSIVIQGDSVTFSISCVTK